jgi:parallel beta-helix repeat protein
MPTVQYRFQRLNWRVFGPLLILSIFLFIPSLAYSATYYVSKTGRDTNTCPQASSQGTARLTIAAALSCLSSGDTLIIGDGTYVETIIDAIPSGSSGRPTTIKAANQNKARLAPTLSPAEYVIRLSGLSYITIDGIDADAGSLSAGAVVGCFPNACSNITLKNGTVRNGRGTYGSGVDGTWDNSLVQNNDIQNNGGSNQLAHGIYQSGSGTTIEGNRVSGSSAWGIHVYSWSAKPVSNNIVRNNKVTGSGKAGILVATGSNNLVYNNVVYGNGSSGIQVYANASSTGVYNNTIYQNGSYCVAVDGSYGAPSNTTIKNNICYMNAASMIYDGGVGTTDSNNLSSDPSLVNPASADFHLRSGSAAIGTGINLYNTLTTDFDSNARPTTSTWDLGAFVYTSGQPSAPTAPTNLRIVGQ